MEAKKRNPDEEIDLRKICIGMKIDNFNGEPGINFSFSTFTVLEKTDYQIGAIEREPFTIYKDMEEERYSYVRPNGEVFMPTGNVSYAPSNHLRSVTDIKTYREVINEIIETYRSLPDLDEETKKVVEFLRRHEEMMAEADRTKLKPKVKLGNVQEQHKFFVDLYILAFGNPLERNFSQENKVRPMTDEEKTEKDVREKAAQDARSQFRVVEGGNAEGPKGKQ